MFAAAAIIAQSFFHAAIEAAKWLATKAFILALMAIVLPWVLKPVLMWFFDYIITYGRQWTEFITGSVGNMVQASGVDLTYQIGGVGGYLATQTGLIEYASIIMTGWGLYWTVAILAKTPKIL
jgi:hypothetical protein